MCGKVHFYTVCVVTALYDYFPPLNVMVAKYHVPHLQYILNRFLNVYMQIMRKSLLTLLLVNGVWRTVSNEETFKIQRK